MNLHTSDSYEHVVDKARWSHAHGRTVSHILPADIEAARLFSYGYRAQTIGAFHATRVAIEAQAAKSFGAYVDSCLYQARFLLEQLETKAVDPIFPDHRAVISTLYSYDQSITLAMDVMEKACARRTHPHLKTIRDLFAKNIQQVTAGNGLYVARDVELPEQGAFVVPDLDISIAPIIYGDHHSWNTAFLAGDRPGVSVHRHHWGAEIHLGFSPTNGQTILGDCFTEVNEGYAMPIPPMTDHGFLNTSGHDHVLPFVFGSLKMAGWGIFFDVEPRPIHQTKRKEERLDSAAMNHSVFLDRAINKMKAGEGEAHEVLVSGERAGSAEIGGLELSLSRAAPSGTNLSAPHYRIVSVRSGRGKIQIGSVEAEVHDHDHFGIPANMECRLSPKNGEPLIFLDAMIVPVPKLGRSS